MDSWQALDTVLLAYRAARTIQPLGGSHEAPGLAALVEPAIDDGFLRKEAFLSALHRAVTRPQDYPGPIFDTAAAAAILGWIDARETQSPTASGRGGSDDEDEDAEADARTERLHRIAPTVMRRLGTARALRLVEDLDDAAIADVEGIAYDSDVARL